MKKRCPQIQQRGTQETFIAPEITPIQVLASIVAATLPSQLFCLMLRILEKRVFQKKTLS